jgi:hypothetical protein
MQYKSENLFPTKPIPPREGRGKRRVLREDGRAAEGQTFGMLGFFIFGRPHEIPARSVKTPDKLLIPGERDGK